MFEKSDFQLFFCSILLLIEMVQIYIERPSVYFSQFNNLMDFCGIISIMFFYTFGHLFSKNTSSTCLIFGLFCVFYRAIGSLCIVNG